MNNIRETIVINLLNDTINEKFFICPIFGKKWLKLKINLFTCLDKSFQISEIKIKALRFGGRNNHFDFLLFVYKNEFMEDIFIEFKHNAIGFQDVPQILTMSVKSSSDFLTHSENENFPSYYYDRFFKINKCYSSVNINKDIYLSEVIKTTSYFLNPLKILSKKDSRLKLNLEQNGKVAIKKYISSCFLNLDNLNVRLIETQLYKVFLFSKQGNFKIKTLTQKDLTVFRYVLDNHRFICETKGDFIILIKMRWKNNLGISNPAVDITIREKTQYYVNKLK